MKFKRQEKAKLILLLSFAVAGLSSIQRQFSSCMPYIALLGYECSKLNKVVYFPEPGSEEKGFISMILAGYSYIKHALHKLRWRELSSTVKYSVFLSMALRALPTVHYPITGKKHEYT